MKKKLLISFSGGETSAYMTKWLLDNKQDEYEMIVVFANTGKENPETLDFIKACDETFGFNTIWVEARFNGYNQGVSGIQVDYRTCSRQGEPFEAMIKKHGIPNAKSPHCSRELKERTIKAYLRSIGWKKYLKAIGIRYDEPRRIHSKTDIIYPLYHMHPMTKPEINNWWTKQTFRLNLKGYQGNCDLCWKKNIKKLCAIVRESPEKAEWWKTMEEKYGAFIPPGRQHNTKLIPPFTFYREKRSMKDIIQMSEKFFEPIKNDAEAAEIWKQTLLFDVGKENESSCSESCEAF